MGGTANVDRKQPVANPPTVLLTMGWKPTALGGVTTAVVNLHDKINERSDARALLLVESWDDTSLRFEEMDGRRVCFLRTRPPYVRGRALTTVAKFLLSLVFLGEHLRLLRSENISIVNVHFPDLAAMHWATLRAIGLFRGRLVLSFHGADVTEIANETNAIGRFLWRVCIKHCYALTACSAQLAAELGALFPFALDKIVVLSNGISPDAIRREAQQVVEQSDRPLGPYLITIAGFERKKGLDVLIKAFRTVAQMKPDLSLVLVCRTGPGLGETRALIAELELEDRIKLLIGYPHAETMSLLANAEILVVPSRKEPFGIVVLEAIVLDRPVVLTNICGVLDVLGDRTALSVVPPNDATALADAITASLASPAAASGPRAQLRARVVSSLTWTSVADRFLKLCSA